MLHFRLYATMAVIVGAILFGGNIGIAEWTEPVCHSELNDFENGYVASEPYMLSDGLSIFFGRQVPNPMGNSYMLFEAWREESTGPFTEERMLEEFTPLDSWIRSPWVSRDGLRLYYAEATTENGQHGGYKILKMAIRNDVADEWQLGRTLSELHVPRTADRYCTLTADELTIMWVTQRPGPYDPVRIMIATRGTTHVPFSNEREVLELNEVGASFPHLSGDSLRVYFTATRPDNGANNIYMMTRASLTASFGNMEHLDGVSGPDAGAGGEARSMKKVSGFLTGLMILMMWLLRVSRLRLWPRNS